MVLYFSGTGNSQFVAMKIAEMIKDEAVSINQYMKKGEKAVIQSGRPLVFVAPVYSWRMPRIVEQWILETEFKDNQNAYYILTCEESSGNAASYAEKLCARKGFTYCGLAQVHMPENYLALFPTPDEAECRKIVERSVPYINALAEKICSGNQFPGIPVSLLEKLKSGPVNTLFYTFFVHDKGFKVSDKCIACGKCVSRCPLNNIDLVEAKPAWRGKCTHCMACIGGCPTEAIEYKSKSKERHHYYIMDDSLCSQNGGKLN